MAKEHIQPCAEKPTLFQKIKAGVKGFFKTAIHYLPRGLLFSGAIIGVSALLGVTTGWDPLQISTAPDFGHIAGIIGRSLLIGSVISGGVGAWQGVKAANHHTGEIAAHTTEIQHCRVAGHQLQPEMDIVTPSTPTIAASKAASVHIV